MSSEEDDDEELLRRALEQQDQTYWRPVMPSPGLSGVPPPAHFNPPQYPPPQYPPPQHPPPQHPPPQHPPPQHPPPQHPPPKHPPPAAPVAVQRGAAAASSAAPVVAQRGAAAASSAAPVASKKGAAVAAAEEPGPPRRNPPRIPPNRAPPPAPAPAMDDDEEESDVEMLSISSDDDTPPPTRRDSKQRDSAKTGKRGDDDSDLEWDEDDQEPENWKNVDQAELVRRVREMREAKTKTPAPPVARLRRTTTIADASRGEDLLDPLNLGVINIKTLTLNRDKREAFQNEKISSNELQAPREEAPIVRDPALREKLMYHSESFDPKLFLAHVHRSTSASDLEAGESALKMDLQNCKDQLKKLVKENFDCFISCKNTIDDIHSKLQQIEEDPEGAGTVHLSEAIQSVDVVAKKAFGPLLERQAQAERIRSVQGMLQRFRTLFNLPSIIRGNISKGEYDLAIREYKKAKSLVQYTHVGILSRVLEEVDKIVLEFKDMLYKTMENPNVDTSQLENTIRLLLELEPESDPIWYYLSIQDRRIRGLLEGCSLEHEARMDALQGRVQEKVQSDARWKQLQRESNRATEVDFNILLGEQDKDAGDGSLRDSTGEEADALLARLVRRLTVVFVQHVPNFWRLALSIFSGKFVKVSQPGSTNGRPIPSNSSENFMYPYEGQVTAQQPRHSMDEVVTMVLTIVSLYEAKVLNTFHALAEAKVHRSHMRDALVEITKASVALQGKDCAPSSAVQALLALRVDVTKIFVLRLCTLMRGATSEFVNDEDWFPVPTTERGGTPYSISHLPLRFRNMLVAAMDNMSEMVQKLTAESAKLHEEQDLTVHQMQDHMRITFMECFLDLADCLGKLALDLSEQIQIQNSSTGEGNGSNALQEDFADVIPGSEVAKLHQRMLMVLSNTAFCKNSLLFALSQEYGSFWTYSKMEEMALEGSSTATTEEVNEALSALERNILEQFINSKATEIKNAAATYVEDGSLWGQSPPVKGIRDNVLELMHPLVEVHSQVYSGAKLFLGEVINASVEALIIALYDVFNDNKTKSIRLLDVNGYCQLTLELDFIDSVFERYFTPAAREGAIALRDMLLEKVCDSVREIQQAEIAAHSGSRPSRGNDEATSLDRAGPTTPDEIQALAHQVSADFLPSESRRVRTNVVCFTELVSEHIQLPRHAMTTLPKSGSARQLLQQSGPNYHHLRKSSGYLGGDSDIGRHSFSYAGSDVGSETSSRAGSVSERYRFPIDRSLHSESRRSLRTSSSKSYDTDLL